MQDEKDAILDIDLSRLEDDCREQSKLLRQWGYKLAKAKRVLNDAEKKLKVTKAEVARAVRSRPEAHGVNSTTIDNVNDAVMVNKEYKAVWDEQIEAQYQVDMIQSMVNALHDRRTELENIVKLHGQMYWSKPNTSDVDTMSAAAKKVKR